MLDHSERHEVVLHPGELGVSPVDSLEGCHVTLEYETASRKSFRESGVCPEGTGSVITAASRRVGADRGRPDVPRVAARLF
jgi:hypothetical protein